MQKLFLYIDDDADDQMLFSDVLHRVAPEVQLTTADDGVKALNMLQNISESDHYPNLIVLDLNLPYLSGQQVYDQLKNHPLYKNIPVVVFSSSENPADKKYFQSQGVSYFSKPFAFSGLENVVKKMQAYST